jgi:formylglycine-generating enzyme required for sulfatase activity
MLKDSYTRYPRAILWLVQGGELAIHGAAKDDGPSGTFSVEPFYMGKLPITNQQLEAFDPSYVRLPHSPGDEDPAVGISHEVAAAYCRWYADVSRKPMRLPTEIEWEYACRGGTSGRYFFGEDPEQGEPYLWDIRNSGGKARDPRKKETNPLGLHGMLGSVWEWTSSFQGSSEVVTPPGPVLRGGSFLMDRDEMGAEVRRLQGGTPGLEDVGFRIVRSF